MKSLQLLLAHPLAADLGWTLVHFVWQGALISALFAAVRGLGAGSTNARARYALACLTLATMAAAPILTYGFLAGSDTWQSVAQVPEIPLSPAASGGALVSGAPWYSLWLGDLQRALPWLVMAWFIGVVVFLIRLAGGSLVAARLRSHANRPAPHHWQDALDKIAIQLGVSRPVRLASSLVEVPAVVGWFRPVVLMPVAALTGLAPEHIEALLAHELGHICRPLCCISAVC